MDKNTQKPTALAVAPKPNLLQRGLEKSRGLAVAAAGAVAVAANQAQAEMTLPSAGGIITAAEVAFTAVATFVVARLTFKLAAAIYAKVTGKG